MLTSLKTKQTYREIR
jgi:hypothetical protein